LYRRDHYLLTREPFASIDDEIAGEPDHIIEEESGDRPEFPIRCMDPVPL
jgi:hypothetical protein